MGAQPPALPQPERRWRARLVRLYLVLAVLGFAALLGLALSVPYLPTDVGVTLAVQGFGPAWFHTLLRWVSWPGFWPQGTLLVLAVAALLWAARQRWEAACAALAGLGPGIVSTVIKELIQRPRPAPALVQVVEALGGFSFPSGHVLFYTVFFGFLFYLVYSRWRRTVGGAVALVVLGGLVALVGVSRIDLGHHWLSDVVAAYLLGSVGLAGVVVVYQRWRPDGP